MNAKFFLIAIMLIYSGAIYAQASRVKVKFRLTESPAIIEGMTYDAVGKKFYFGESLSKRILSYTFDGKPAGYIDAAKDGMTSVLGMNVHKGHIWICGAIGTDSTRKMCIFEYDLKTSRLINKYPDTSGKAQLFNDVAITSNGDVFVTETYTRSLYKADRNNFVATLYMHNDSVRDANGITANGNTIFVSTSRGFTAINTINDSIRKLQLANFIIAGNDGLYHYKNSLVGIQNVLFPVSINQYFLDSAQQKIIKGHTLASDDPSFAIPTTGAIVGDELYFMSNNNIGKEDSVSSKKLKPVTVASIMLSSQ
jgi:hypothetical protein